MNEQRKRNPRVSIDFWRVRRLVEGDTRRSGISGIRPVPEEIQALFVASAECVAALGALAQKVGVLKAYFGAYGDAGSSGNLLLCFEPILETPRQTDKTVIRRCEFLCPQPKDTGALSAIADGVVSAVHWALWGEHQKYKELSEIVLREAEAL